MKLLIDIGHPAHVHFFSGPIRLLKESGWDIFVTSRHKEMATDLLDALHIRHEVLSSLSRGSLASMGKELVQRDIRLYRVIKRERPDILAGIGGVFIAHAGFLTRTPSIVFYDTENATLSNLITYPFCSLVAVPECYQAWLPPWHLRYPGYHELSYLHPQNFTPDKNIAIACGLDPGRPTFLIRTVSWQASHDLQEKGWDLDLLRNIVLHLNRRGKVILSAEGLLPEDLKQYSYAGPFEQIHHLMGHARMFIGESATMASECAVMGVPAIFAANTGRGYTNEQQHRYNLVRNLKNLDWPSIQAAIDDILELPASIWQERRQHLLADKIDVSRFVAELIQDYPRSRGHFANVFRKAREE